MRKLRELPRSAIASASTLRGKRFGIFVASSLVATSAIVASALTNPTDNGPLAALLGRSLASDTTPASTSPAAGASLPAAATTSGPGPSTPSEGPAAEAGGSLAAPAPSPAPAASGPVSDSSSTATPTTPTSPPPPQAGRIKHVFLISLASPGYDASFGSQSQMPYLSGTLRPQGELLSGYSLLDPAALPNEIATVSGQPPNSQTDANCSTYSEFPPNAAIDPKSQVVGGAGCVYPVDAQTLSDQLTAGGFKWRAYVDGMVDDTGKPHNCAHPDSGGPDQPALGAYAASQNPFVYFHSLLDLGDCAINDLPLSSLPADLGKPTATPNFSYLAPSLCDAGVSGQCPAGAADGAAGADAFLSQWVPKILASAAYKQDGLLIVDFDQAPPTDPAAAPATATTPVGALLVSKYVTRGATDSGPYGPYSLLRTTEDLFGLNHLAAAGGSKVRTLAPALLGTSGGD